MRFEDVFRTGDARRDNYRSRLFGMFSEDIARIWGQNPSAPYRYLGRPTIFDGAAYATVDFLFGAPDGRRFVAEQKSELAWMSYAYLRLVDGKQVDHHAGKPAFDWFLEAAREPAKRPVRVAGKPVAVDGAILVWGAVEPEGRQSAIETFGFHDVLSLESMLDDLRAWQDPAWAARLDELDAWSSGLLEALR